MSLEAIFTNSSPTLSKALAAADDKIEENPRCSLVVIGLCFDSASHFFSIGKSGAWIVCLCHNHNDELKKTIREHLISEHLHVISKLEFHFRMRLNKYN